MSHLLIVGFDEPEFLEIKERLQASVSQPESLLWSDSLPRIQVVRGELLAESRDRFGLHPVSRVVFHGIFENDFPFLTALALWGGPCLPGARGMMDCRLRVPCLVRSLAVTRFGTMLRGYAPPHEKVFADADTVAKWGEWHCGENKEKFQGSFTTEVPTLFEPFTQGKAVRVHLTGDRAWQLSMDGDGWKKSIHHPGAGFMTLDPELVEDARNLQQAFALEMLAVDYIVGDDGNKYLLEVNHIPNVTLFPELREAYLEYVVEWVKQSRPG
ncbi:MAG: hypothetical protein ACFCD0_11215 [Gemmataceae bacterium]